MLTVVEGLDESGASSTAMPLARRYSVMPSTEAMRVSPGATFAAAVVAEVAATCGAASLGACADAADSRHSKPNVAPNKAAGLNRYGALGRKVCVVMADSFRQMASFCGTLKRALVEALNELVLM